MQIPLQLGAAFSAAARQDFKSPVAQSAMFALSTLLWHACDAGIASNTASIQQQLQQSGLQQQLPAVLAAMTAELQAEIAVLEGGSDAASAEFWRFCGDGSLQLQLAATVGSRYLLWEFWEAAGLSGTDWVWGPGGLADIVMQFTTAALQHVLPALRKRSPHLAEKFLCGIESSSQLAGMLCVEITSTPVSQSQRKQQGQGLGAGIWQQLLLSPHLLPCVAAVVVMAGSHLDRSLGVRCAGNCSSTIGSSSWNREPSSSSNSRSSGSDNVGSAFTAGQLQLLQLLRLAPEVMDWVVQLYDLDVWYMQLHQAAEACYECCDASWRLVESSSAVSGELLEQQQRWQYEQQLWRLLPTVLLPCTSSLLLPMQTSTPQQRVVHGEELVLQLLALSSKASGLSAELESTPSATPPAAAWVDEHLGVLLQLADRLLYQQPPRQTATAAAAATSSSSASSSMSATRSLCAAQFLPLLLGVARYSQALVCGPSSSDSCSSHNPIGEPQGVAAANCSSRALAVPVLAPKVVEYVAALDATLRATSEAAQSGAISSGKFVQLCACVTGLCLLVLLPDDQHTNSVLLQHIGLCGPAALSREQQQLYSLLSTLQKLRCCIKATGQLWYGERMADACCLAAACTSVGLLRMASAPAEKPSLVNQQSVAAAAAAAAAAATIHSAAAIIHSVAYLPSLVLFGRCMLQWAEQLQQQEAGQLMRKLLTLHEEQHVAARVCIPLARQGPALAPGERLESLAAIIHDWVGQCNTDSPAHQQLAAAGCSPEQLQQQLDALLSAQQGTKQGVSDASLAALVQQLQATGAMLSGIAVPQFCNNPACTNLSGPTEVRLVSGRSCICAGCRIARYCGRACLRAARTQHKPVCEALAAAAATAATAQGS